MISVMRHLSVILTMIRIGNPSSVVAFAGVIDGLRKGSHSTVELQTDVAHPLSLNRARLFGTWFIGLSPSLQSRHMSHQVAHNKAYCVEPRVNNP